MGCIQTCKPACLSSNLPPCKYAFLLTFLTFCKPSKNLPSFLPFCLPAYMRTCLLNCLPAYLSTSLPAYIQLVGNCLTGIFPGGGWIKIEIKAISAQLSWNCG